MSELTDIIRDHLDFFKRHNFSVRSVEGADGELKELYLQQKVVTIFGERTIEEKMHSIEYLERFIEEAERIEMKNDFKAGIYRKLCLNYNGTMNNEARYYHYHLLDEDD